MPMLENAEVIAKYNNYAFINCMTGMCMEKYKALEHPYPTLVEKIEKYGYDPKQLHHIVRINEFMIRYIAGESYKDCLTSKKAEYLIDIKRGCHTLEEARQIAKSTLDDTVRRKDEYMKSNPLVVNKFVEYLMNEVLINVLKKSFILDLEV